jgi:hypothetical protein
MAVRSTPNIVEANGKAYHIDRTLDSAEFVADAMVEALHRRAGGGAAVLLEAAEHLIREAALGGALAELAAVEAITGSMGTRAGRHGDEVASEMIYRVGAVIRMRRKGAASVVAARLTEAAQW